MSDRYNVYAIRIDDGTRRIIAAGKSERDFATTQRYLRVDERHLRQAVERLERKDVKSEIGNVQITDSESS